MGKNKQISGGLYISFCTKFENPLIIFYYPKGCISYVPQVWL